MIKNSIEENIEILEKFKNNKIQRDKLERDVRCGGWKIGDIYKCLELDNAIDNILSDYKKVLKENEELNEKILDNAGIYQLGFKDGEESYIKKVKEMRDELDRTKAEYMEWQKQELEQKDKIIDLMAETINNHDIDEDICKQMGQKANCNEFEDTEKCKECIKQYFENKAKEIK